jgi:chromosome segregation ATPase
MPRRGLHSMQTRASRKAVASLQTPELYLKLTSLEIERSRRANELEYLMERLSNLQNRIRTIVEEQDELQGRIDVQQRTLPPTIPSSNTVNQSVGLTY